MPKNRVLLRRYVHHLTPMDRCPGPVFGASDETVAGGIVFDVAFCTRHPVHRCDAAGIEAVLPAVEDAASEIGGKIGELVSGKRVSGEHVLSADLRIPCISESANGSRTIGLEGLHEFTEAPFARIKNKMHMIR